MKFGLLSSRACSSPCATLLPNRRSSPHHGGDSSSLYLVRVCRSFAASPRNEFILPSRWRGGKKWKIEIDEHGGRPQFFAMAGPVIRANKDHRQEGRFLEIARAARQKFAEQVSLRSEDNNISLAKALLYVAAEDEALEAHARDQDARSILAEMEVSFAETSVSSPEPTDMDSFTMRGKSVSGWLQELDALAAEVEEELRRRRVDRREPAALEAVNAVIFDRRCFRTSLGAPDSESSYLHSALSSARCTGVILSAIYVETCRRLGIQAHVSRVGEQDLVLSSCSTSAETSEPPFVVVNGRRVRDETRGASLVSVQAAGNREIIGMALANLMRLRWRRASSGTSSSSSSSSSSWRYEEDRDATAATLLRPRELRLAAMASERALMLRPRDWALRREHGMLLYHSRRYGNAVRELSVCMAFAPEEAAAALRPLVQRLHLLRLESGPSWTKHGALGGGPTTRT